MSETDRLALYAYGDALRQALPFLAVALLQIIDSFCRLDNAGEPIPGTLPDEIGEEFDQLVAAIRAAEACVGPLPPDAHPYWLREAIDGRYPLKSFKA